MNNYDYPLGSDTPDAPWNQVNEPTKNCPICLGSGHICSECNDDSLLCECDGKNMEDCQECNGTGEVFMTEEEIEDEHDFWQEIFDEN